jgi:hypothetical protein
MVQAHHYYREYLFQTYVAHCAQTIFSACNSEIENCRNTERNRGMLLPDSEVKEIRFSSKVKQAIRIRPQVLLTEVPQKEELQWRFKLLNGEEQKNFQAIFTSCIDQVTKTCKGFYAEVLKCAEGIATLNESAYLKYLAIAQAKLYTQDLLKIAEPKAAL